jgi:hypothetical protein
MMGLVREEFRLPLVKMRGDKRRLLRGMLKEYGIIS